MKRQQTPIDIKERELDNLLNTLQSDAFKKELFRAFDYEMASKLCSMFSSIQLKVSEGRENIKRESDKARATLKDDLKVLSKISAGLPLSEYKKMRDKLLVEYRLSMIRLKRAKTIMIQGALSSLEAILNDITKNSFKCDTINKIRYNCLNTDDVEVT